jgi:hypothetical protein
MISPESDQLNATLAVDAVPMPSHLRKPNIGWAAIFPAAFFDSLHLCRFRQKITPFLPLLTA